MATALAPLNGSSCNMAYRNPNPVTHFEVSGQSNAQPASDNGVTLVAGSGVTLTTGSGSVTIAASGGGGGGSTLTYTTTSEYTIDYTDIDAASGTITLDAAQQIPANSRLVRINWELVTPWSYTSWGSTYYVSSPALFEIDGLYYIPTGGYKYTLYGNTSISVAQNEIFGLNGASTKLNQCAPNIKIGSSATTPKLVWEGWNNYYGASSNPAEAGSAKVSFEYLVIS